MQRAEQPRNARVEYFAHLIATTEAVPRAAGARPAQQSSCERGGGPLRKHIVEEVTQLRDALRQGIGRGG